MEKIYLEINIVADPNHSMAPLTSTKKVVIEVHKSLHTFLKYILMEGILLSYL